MGLGEEEVEISKSNFDGFLEVGDVMSEMKTTSFRM